MAFLRAYIRAQSRGMSRLLFITMIVALCTMADNSLAIADEQEQFSRHDVEAAYIVNFAKYVEWPDGTFPDAKSPFVIGILGTNPFGNTLAQLASEQDLGGRPIEIKQSDDVTELSTCQIVYLSGGSAGISAPDLAAFSGKPVVTVAEHEDFAKDGGIVNFVQVDSKVKFEINLKAAKHVNLKVSSRLLKLAIKIFK